MTKKAQKGEKFVKVTQIKSPIGRNSKQRLHLIGLGLNKLHRTKTLIDTPSVRGLINEVSHLIVVEEIA